MEKMNNHKRRNRTTLLACTAAITVAGSTQVEAEPHECFVANGQVIINQAGNTWVIQATDGAVLQCQSFDVAFFELVNFLQPSSSARLLNYITGGQPTSLDGTLLATGIVYFVNPAGVMFGQNAVIDVGGIFAAASDLGDMANQPDLDNALNNVMDMGGTGQIRFETVTGNVSIDAGAQVHAREVAHFIGNFVDNQGMVMLDDGGLTTMSAGDTVVITNGLPTDVGTLSVAIPASSPAPGNPPVPGVLNAGTIQAPNGQVVLGAGDLYSLAVRHTGTLVAGKVTMQSDNNGAAGAGDVDVLADVTSNGDQDYIGDEVTFDGTYDTNGEDFTVNGRTTLAGDTTVNAHGGKITFQDTIDGTTAGVESLTLLSEGANGTETNAVDLQGDVGATTALKSLEATSTGGADNSIALQDVTTIEVTPGNATDSHQTYTADLVTLNSVYDTQGGDFKIDGAAVLKSDTTVNTDGGSITFTGTINADVAGMQSLDLDATALNAGDDNFVDLQDDVGDTSALKSLDILAVGQGTTNRIDVKSVKTDVVAGGGDGHQTYEAERINFGDANSGTVTYETGGGTFNAVGPAVLGADTKVMTSGGAITFNGTIEGTAAGEQSLELSAVGAGNNAITIMDTVGQSTALEFFLAESSGGARNSISVMDLATDEVAGGTGNQTYTAATVTFNGDVDLDTHGGDFLVTGDAILGGDVTVGAGGGSITFDGNVDAGTAGADSLTANTSGVTEFKNGAIGGTTALDFVQTDAAGTTRLGGDVTLDGGDSEFKDDVLLTADVAINGVNGATVEFEKRLDTAAGLAAGQGDLALNLDNTGSTTFFGAVGSGGTAGAKAGLGSGSGPSLTQTNDSGTATFRDDVTLTGGATFDSNVVLATGLTFTGGDTVRFGDTATDTLAIIGGDAFVDTSAANAAVDVKSSTTLASGLTVNAGSGTIDMGAVDGNQALALNSTGATNLNGAVGANTALQTLTTDAGGTTTIASNVNLQGGASAFNDNVLLQTDVIFTGTGGASLLFAGLVDTSDTAGPGQGDLVLNMDATGSTTFDDAVGSGGTTGSKVGLGSGGVTSLVQASNSGSVTFRENVNLSGGAQFQSDVVLDGMTFRAGNTVTFGSDAADTLTTSGDDVVIDTSTANAIVNLNAATTLGSDLTVNSGSGNIFVAGSVDGPEGLALNSTGETRITGTIGGNDPLTSLSTNAGGTTFLGSDITTDGNTITFGDNVQLTNSVELVSLPGSVTFEGTIDGTHTLTVTADRATFKGNIGGTTMLQSFETVVGRNVPDGETPLIFEGVTITAVGDVIFNDSFKLAFNPTAATIGSDGPLTIISITGNFTMGRNQKMTVSSAVAGVPGTLTVTLGAGAVATLGDVTTLNDMNVTVGNGGKIVLRPRNQPGADNSLDFVAGGVINFNVVPEGDAGAEFANPDGQVDGSPDQTLATFVQRAFAVQLADSELVERSPAGTALRFRSLQAAGPSTTDPADAIAGALPQEAELGEVVVAPLLAPVGRNELFRNLLIPAQELPVRPNTIGAGALWNDFVPTALLVSPERVQVQRLQTALAEQALSAHAALMADNTQAIKAVLEEGWFDYTDARGEDADPALFPGFLLAAGNTEAAGFLRSLHDIHNPVILMGPTDVELQGFERQFMDDYKPDGMSEEGFRAAMAAAADAQPLATPPAAAAPADTADPAPADDDQARGPDSVLPVPAAKY